MKKILLTFFAVLFILMAQAQDEKIQIFYASLDNPEANPVKEFEFKNYEGKIGWGHDIEVIPAYTFQTIEGIGGAFNEIGGEALLSLDKKQQEELMNNLFNADNAGFTFCRTAIGASDFGIDAYSYSEVAEDYEMKKFSVKRDKKYVLPYLQAAFAVNPELKLFASPWSPPAWMKVSGLMTGPDPENNKMRADDKIYEAYATYFVKYIQAYAENGVKVSRICIQNETDADTNYPSCVMQPDELLNIGLNYMKPAFKKAKLKTEIYAGTFRVAKNFVMPNYLLLKDASKLDGIGVQYTASRYIQEAQLKFPEYKIMHTEGNCFGGQNSVKQAESRLREISDNINANCTNFCYWNMILNETTKSGWDWNQNSLINIDRTNKTIQYNPDYNVMYLVSKFVKPGDVRIGSMASGRPIISVKDENGAIKIIIQNTSDTEDAYRIKLKGKETQFLAPARAIMAIVIKQ
jgi:glucosylceramidase